jgi:hypothetical protein
MDDVTRHWMQAIARNNRRPRVMLWNAWRTFKVWIGYELPIGQTMIGLPKKDPNCTEPMCNRKGIRKDLRMRGGGKVWCHCAKYKTVELERANKIRRFFGFKEIE